MLSEVRRQNQMTQAEMAAMVGVTQAQISKIEAGIHPLPLVNFIDVLCATGTHVTIRFCDGLVEIGPAATDSTTLIEFNGWTDVFDQ